MDLSGPILLKPKNSRPRKLKEPSLLRLVPSRRRHAKANRAQQSKNRSVVIKLRIATNDNDTNKAKRRLAQHIRYLERSGVGIDGGKPEMLASKGTLQAKELQDLVREWSQDRHHFRFIISPEDGHAIDLPSFTKELIEKMEREVGTKLEWLAVPHYNTDNPHIHLLIRGKTDKGHDLVLSRDFIKDRFREHAEDLATQILGPKTELERKAKFQRSLTQDRFVSLDRTLISDANKGKNNLIEIPPRCHLKREWVKQLNQDKLTRLQHLKGLGLASEVTSGFWSISPELERNLRALSKRREIVARVHNVLKDKAKNRNIEIVQNAEDLARDVVGEVLSKGLVNELFDKKFVVLESDRSSLLYAELSTFSEVEGFESFPGALIRLRKQEKWRADRFILSFSKENAGEFDSSKFLEFIDSSVKKKTRTLPDDLTPEEYTETFIERCKTLTRLGVIAEKRDHVWVIPLDLVERVQDTYKKLGQDPNHLQLQVESYFSIGDQTERIGATWLDKELVKPTYREAFTRGKLKESVEAAIEKRRRWHEERSQQISGTLISKLQLREVDMAAGRLLNNLGQKLSLELNKSARGRLRRYELLSDGYYAIITSENGFYYLPISNRHRRLEVGSEVELRRGKGNRIELRALTPERRKATERER